MLKTLELRKRWALLVLGASILVATYVAIPGDPFYAGIHNVKDATTRQAMDVVANLNRREVLHIMGHIFTFGLVALLLGAWGLGDERGTLRLVLKYALIGAITMEGAQIFVHYLPAIILYLSQSRVSPLLENGELQKDFWGTWFDFGVDVLAAYGGWWISQRQAERITMTAVRLKLT